MELILQKASDRFVNIIVFIFLLVYPFLVVRTGYFSDLPAYSWYFGNENQTDFFLQFRAWFLVAVGIVSLPFIIYKIKTDKCYPDKRVMVISTVYSVGLIASMLLSVNRRTSLIGLLGQFEGAFVLLSYIVIMLLFYFYKSEFVAALNSKLVKGEAVVLSSAMIILGFLQKGEVYLTFSNPDYASLFVIVLTALNIYFFINSTKKTGYINLAFILMLAVVQIRTGCITNIAVLFYLFAGCALIYFYSKGKIEYRLVNIIIVVPFVAVFLLLLSGAVSNRNESYYLKSVTTKEEEVVVETEDEVFRFSNDEDKSNTGLNYSQVEIEADGEKMQGFTVDGGYEKLTFVYSDKNKRYMQYTGYKKLLNLTPSKVWPFTNNFNFLSRGYIWGTSIPMIPEYIAFGTGPDAYVYAAPHGDYANSLNGGYLYKLITKPHSLYLQILIQTGIVPFLCFLCLNGMLIYFNINNKINKNALLLFILLCSFLFNYFMNDSCVAVSPYYWAILGTGIGTIRNQN